MPHKVAFPFTINPVYLARLKSIEEHWERVFCKVTSPFLMRLPLILYIRHNWRELGSTGRESISYILQSHVPISNKLIIYPVYPTSSVETLGESISYTLQNRVPISNKLTINLVYPLQLERALESTGREYQVCLAKSRPHFHLILLSGIIRCILPTQRQLIC